MSRIRDLERDIPSPEERTDVCVLGAGAAGIVLTMELLRLGKRVTLLEAGGVGIEAASQEPYRSEISGLPHTGIHAGRFRVYGGSTTRWGGQILELDDEDFEQRPNVPGSGWPFPKAALRSFYERALHIEGLGSVLREDRAVWANVGASAPALSGLDDYFSRWCPEPNFARLHGETLRSHPHLNVWLHANAVGLNMEGEHVTGIQCRTLTGRVTTFAADNYVFCLGGIESIRFFLQPRESALPWNRSGLLGKHFQDHIDGRGAEVLPVDRKRFHNTFDNIFIQGLKYQLKVRLSPEKQARLDTLNVAGNMIFITDDKAAQDRVKATARHLLKGRWAQVNSYDLEEMARHTPTVLRQAYRYTVHHRLYNPPDAKILLRIWCEQEPTGESSISLSGMRDSLGMLRTRVDWRISDRELASMRCYIQAAAHALQGLATLQPDVALIEDTGEFRNRCEDCNHHMGGMRMSTCESSGVVDKNLRLYGTANTYVCSSAVFPTSGYSNPTHTVLALAVRLADHLALR